MLDKNFLMSIGNCFPDPALEARMLEECYSEIRDASVTEEEYSHWDSRVSEARIEQQWWERDKDENQMD